MEKVEIIFDYEYNCGGYAYSRSVEMPKEVFNEDKLLILVCSYLQSYFGYPGETIDEYLHNKFPDTHTLEDMCGYGIYNIFACHVNGLKSFGEITDGLLNTCFAQAEDYMLKECWAFNESKKGQPRPDFSIWKK